jgi:hypothetical protein
MSDPDRPFQSQYFFSIDTRLDGKPVGDVPGGFRMDIAYEEGGRVWTQGEKYFRDWIERRPSLTDWWKPIEGVPDVGVLEDSRLAYDAIATLRKLGKFDPYGPEVRRQHGDRKPELEWYGLDGEVLSGGDWTMVRHDGVVRFEGRMTIRSSDEDRALLDTCLTAVVDLRQRAQDSIQDGGSIYRRWRSSGFGKGREVPVVFAATFESAQQAAPSWAPKRYARQAEQHWKYARLTRGQFVAVGKVALDTASLSPMKLDVFEVYA